MSKVPFFKPWISDLETKYALECLNSGRLIGDGPYTAKATSALSDLLGGARVLLTHSATGALELAALLADVQPGDEIIMPSYTFVSTANAFVLRGAVPVFIDIQRESLNLDATKIEEAVSKRTKAIVPVHYAGVSCDMPAIQSIAKTHRLNVIEDAAQALGSRFGEEPLGTIGDFGALSFHGTKNLISGEGGALIVRDPAQFERARIFREKGTNRSAFLAGFVDKYTWMDQGSSFLPSDLMAAVLLGQLERFQEIQNSRRSTWLRYYHELKADCEAFGGSVNEPADGSNYHIFYFLAPSHESRTRILGLLREDGIEATFHYIPLHSSPAGRRFAKTVGDLKETDHVARTIVRLPLWGGMPEDTVAQVINACTKRFRGLRG